MASVCGLRKLVGKMPKGATIVLATVARRVGLSSSSSGGNCCSEPSVTRDHSRYGYMRSFTRWVQRIARTRWLDFENMEPMMRMGSLSLRFSFPGTFVNSGTTAPSLDQFMKFAETRSRACARRLVPWG